LLTGGAYWRSLIQGERFIHEARVKHELNFCQVYAFNYQQRHPERFRGNAFTDCAPLMQHDFGHATPSFFQAVGANPRAMAAFIAWNGRLLPSGLQVALFGAGATGDNPDYFPVKTNEVYPAVLSVIGLALIAAGLASMRRRRVIWRNWLTARKWAVITMGGLASTVLIVVLTQRPRPEYIYPLTVGLMALLGLSAEALLPRLRETLGASALAGGVVTVLVLAVPAFYQRGPRPLHDAVARLQPVRSRLQQPGSVLIMGGDGTDTCYYLAARLDRYCTSPSWATLQQRMASGLPIRVVLNQAKATAIYADATVLADPEIARLVAVPAANGWRTVASGTGEGGPWYVLVRAS
jgi:hypothetical protein